MGAEAVRDGLAVSLAYCAEEGPGGCGGKAATISPTNVTCRIAAELFDETWLANHRAGENDYVKTLIEEPISLRAARFGWRSIVGALGGLAVHAAVSRCYAAGDTAKLDDK